MIRIPGTIPINIHPIFWALTILIAILNGTTVAQILIWIAIVFISVLIHEYGHALTAYYFGQHVHIDLLGFGGLTHRHGKKLKKWQDFLVTFNGPLAGMFFCGVTFLIYTFMQPNADSLLNYALKSTIIINIFWTILNLLPIQPLDGGHLLSITLEAMFGLKGVKIALFISIILAALMTIAGFAMNQLFIGIIFFMFTFENYRLWKNSLPLTDVDQDSVLQNMLKSAKKEMLAGNTEEALSLFDQIRDVSKSGVIYLTATESMAEMLYQLGRYEEGYQKLLPLSSKLTPEGLSLFQKLSFHSENWMSAAKAGERAYQLFPGYEVALINALSYSSLNQVTPAIGWLQCAIRDGLPNVRAILSKTEFDPIRTDPKFRDLQLKF